MYKLLSISFGVMLSIVINVNTLNSQTLIYDDFEGYESNLFPMSWFERYNGAGHNQISSAHSHSGAKSFYLCGVPGWSATIENHITLVNRSPRMSYEYFVFFENLAEFLSNFYDYDPIWGGNYGDIAFETDGYIYAQGTSGGTRLMQYFPNQWYKVKVEADSISARYKVWINDFFYGDTFVIPNDADHRWSESYFTIHSRHAGVPVWIDDVKIWRGNSKILQDDFEGYTVDLFPMTWFERYNGAGNNHISTVHSASGTKSLFLQGVSGWSAVIENHIAQIAGNSVMSYQYRVFFENRAEFTSGFYDYDPPWGFAYGVVAFETDGYIYASGSSGGIQLRQYSTNEWYKVKVVADSVNARYSVWINDVNYGDTYVISFDSDHRWSESYFHFQARWAGIPVWVDDVTIYKGVLLGIEEKIVNTPSCMNYALYQNWPNPFANQTIIRYSLPIETDVSVKIINTAGKVVSTLINGRQKRGFYNITWNLKGNFQSKLPNGVYICCLETGEFIATKKIVKTE